VRFWERQFIQQSGDCRNTRFSPQILAATMIKPMPRRPETERYKRTADAPTKTNLTADDADTHGWAGLFQSAFCEVSSFVAIGAIRGFVY
jgi:hypothetical protein